jgi:hypothetical protein
MPRSVILQRVEQSVSPRKRQPGRRRRSKVMTVKAAALTGDEREILVALRDRLADAINDCPARDLAQLARRLQEVIRDLHELNAREQHESEQVRRGDEGWNQADV